MTPGVTIRGVKNVVSLTYQNVLPILKWCSKVASKFGVKFRIDESYCVCRFSPYFKVRPSVVSFLFCVWCVCCLFVWFGVWLVCSCVRACYVAVSLSCLCMYCCLCCVVVLCLCCLIAWLFVDVFIGVCVVVLFICDVAFVLCLLFVLGRFPLYVQLGKEWRSWEQRNVFNPMYVKFENRWESPWFSLPIFISC
jgi:hypothetical protein